MKRQSEQDLGLPSVLVFGQVDSGDRPERPEQLLQVSLPSVLGQIGHTDRGVVVGCKGRYPSARLVPGPVALHV